MSSFHEDAHSGQHLQPEIKTINQREMFCQTDQYFIHQNPRDTTVLHVHLHTSVHVPWHHLAGYFAKQVIISDH